jgi:hypothetical protein
MFEIQNYSISGSIWNFRTFEPIILVKREKGNAKIAVVAPDFLSNLTAKNYDTVGKPKYKQIEEYNRKIH